MFGILLITNKLYYIPINLIVSAYNCRIYEPNSPLLAILCTFQIKSLPYFTYHTERKSRLIRSHVR